jgi:hypothetical protein
LAQDLAQRGSYKKGEHFVQLGQIPTKVGKSGICNKGIIFPELHFGNGRHNHHFFPEGRFAASVGAMLTYTPSVFSVMAVEDTKVLSYDFFEFKKLTETTDRKIEQ